MTKLLLLAAGNGGGTSLFSIGHNLATKLGALAGEFLILIVGVIVLGHIMAHRVAAAVVILGLALIPAWLFFDPTGATHAYQSTIGSL